MMSSAPQPTNNTQIANTEIRIVDHQFGLFGMGTAQRLGLSLLVSLLLAAAAWWAMA